MKESNTSGSGTTLSDEELRQYTTLCNTFVEAFNA